MATTTYSLATVFYEDDQKYSATINNVDSGITKTQVMQFGGAFSDVWPDITLASAKLTKREVTDLLEEG